MRMPMLAAAILASGLALGAPALAGPPTGNAVDRHLDRRGHRIDARLDRRAERAENLGRPHAAHRLDRRGARIEERLDRRGDRIDRRLGGSAD